MASDETVRFIMGHSVDMSNISATTREELNKYEILLLNVNSFHGKQNDRGWMRFWILIINGFILIPTVVLVSLSYGIQAIGDICGVAILFFIIISLSYAVYTYSEDQNIIRKNITQQKQVYEIGIKIKEMIEQDLNRVYNQKISSTKKTIIVDLNRLFEQIQKNGLTIPYRCPNCNATLKINKNNRFEICPYCKSSIDITILSDLINAVI